MANKILTDNGVDNTNIDGARAEYFNAGMRDGIVKGAFNEGVLTASGNRIVFDTCELRVSGHRIIVDEAWSYGFSSTPSVSTRYALVATVSVDNNSNVSFGLTIQGTNIPLIKNNLFRTENGAGTYQVEIGRFTLTTNGTIADVVRTLDTITGGNSGIGEHFIAGNITTTMLDAGMDANVTAEDIYNANGDYEHTDFSFELPATAGTVVKVNNVEQANLDFTSDPQTQLNGKVNKETGKGLSTNDYTTAEKTKLGGIEAEANKTIVDSALSSTSENPVQNKVVKDALDTKADADNVYTKTEIDSRTIIKKDFTYDYSQTIGTSTTAIKFGDNTDSVSFLSHDRPLIISGSIIAIHDGGGNHYISLYIDGSQVGGEITTSGSYEMSLNWAVTNLTSGTHTIQFMAHTNIGTVKLSPASITNIIFFEL